MPKPEFELSYPLFTSVENELHTYKPGDGMPTEARLNAVMATKIRMKSLFDLRAPSDLTRILDSADNNSKDVDIAFKEEKVNSGAAPANAAAENG